MARDSQAGTPRPFDVQTIEHLIGLMAQHELSEISLAEGDQKIRLRKLGPPPAVLPSPPGMPLPLTAYATPPAVPGAAATSPTAEPAKPAKIYHEIKSPMVGTFYAKPSPDKPDYVNLGSRVTPASVVCKIEAMKIFNDLTAEISGTIVEICVKNGQPVDFGTVLFRVDAD